MNYEIRIFSPEDTPRILEIFNQNQKECTLADWEHRYLTSCKFVLLTEFNTLVGFAALKRTNDTEPAEVGVYLDLNFQNLGLERLLLKRLIFCSESNNVKSLTTTLSKTDWERLSLYEKQGFDPSRFSDNSDDTRVELIRK